jgi:hypothetical protein
MRYRKLDASGDCYVYGLFRPDTGRIFYIGMGKNNRAWDHQQIPEGWRRGRTISEAAKQALDKARKIRWEHSL